MTVDTRINPIESFRFTPENTPPVEKKTVNSFESVFNAAMDVIQETNGFQLAASQAQTDLATGRTDDILAVMLAQEKAYSSLNYTVQVTNKIIESYREIMRMQL